MTRAKKVILALICAAALCCAAIGGVLLARQPAHAAAGDVTALEIVIPDNTRFYVFEDLADVKGKITVNAEIEGGSSRQLDASEYVLSVQGRGDMTEANGQTFGNTAAGTYTLIVEPADGVQAAGDVRGTKAIEVRIDEVIGIEAAYDATAGQTVFPHTPYNELQNYITVSLVYAGGRRLSTNDYVLSGDMIAPAQIEGGGNTYDVELNVTYNGENFAGEEENRKCTVTITGVTAVAPARIILNGNRPTSRSGESFDEVQSRLTFTVNYTDFGSNSEVHWNAENFKWYYTKYENGVYEVVTDGTKTAFDWETSNGGLERIAFTYTEGGETIPNDSSTGSIIESGGKQYYYVEIQLLKEPYPELDIVTEYGAYSHGNPVADLPYKYGEAGVGQEQIVSLGQQSTTPFNHEIVSITSVMRQASQGNSQNITENAVVLKGGEQTGEVSLTEVGTYTITLTLVNDMYYWSSLGENGDNFITYTVTIIPAELDLGVSFTGETENDAGVAKSGWTYGGSVTETANGTLSVGETDILTVTGNYGDGKVTYHFLDASGSEIGTSIPTNAGNYYVYVSVAASADGRFAASSMKPDDGTSYTEWAVPFIIGKQEVSPYTETTPESDGGQMVFDYAVYTGRTLTAVENDPNDCYSIVTNAGGTDVDDYNVELQLDARNNYRWEGKTAELSGADFDNSVAFAQTTVTFRIVKAENSLTVTISGWTYGETASEPSFSASFGEPNHTYYRLTGTGREPVEDIAMAGAGDYVVVATVANTDNYGTYKDGAWVDTVAEAQFTIARQGVDLPSGIQTQRTYDYGNTLTAWNGSSQAYTVSGNTATVTGDYTVTFTLNDNYQWKESVVGGSGQPTSTTAEYSVDWSVKPLAVSVPTGSDPDYTYDGSAQTYTFTGWTAGKNNIAPISVLVEEGEAVISDAADAAAGTVSLTDAGNYTITLSLTDTTNFVWADGGDAEREFAFTINKANNDLSVTVENWTYDDGSAVVPSVSGNNSGAAVIYTVTGVTDTSYSQSGSWAEVKPVNAGQYTLTVSVQETDNYNADTSESVSFTISQKGVTVGFASDTEYTYTGAAVDVVLTVDGLSVDLADNEYFTVVSGYQGTDAGSYTATIAWKGNYKESGAADDFATAQRSKEVGTWTIDPFAVSLPESEEYTTTFSNTQQSWTWSNYDGNDTVLTVDAFTVSVTSEPASLSGCGKGDSGLYAKYAGAYTFTLALNNEDGKTNFVWNSGTANDTADKTLTWTINKAVVTTVALGSGDDTGRQIARQEGVGQAPQISVTVNGAVGDPGLFTVEGYKTGLAGSIESQKPSDYGTYYVVLQLTDANNYQWAVNEADQNAAALGGEDTIPQENTAQLWVIYQITGTVYSISIDDISGWEYGKDTPNVPAIGGNTTALVSALNSGATISYTFERQNGNGWEKVSFDQSAYLAADGYSLTAVPEEVAGAAGMYRVSVSVTETPDNNYSAAGDVSNTFTISPYTLTEDDIAWRELSPTYKGSAYTYGTSADNDVYARYYTYSYENGIYVRSSSADAFFSLTLTNGDDAFTDAGSYTFTASTESGNYALSKDLAAKTYIIARAELTISVTGTYEITYGDEAPTQFTFGYDTLLGNDSADSWGVTATTDYKQYDPISSDMVQYTISIVGKDYDPNYTISYEGATLTVKAAGLTVSVIESVSRTYDGWEHPLQAGGSNSIYGSIVKSAVSVNDQAISWKFATAAFNADGTITSGGSEIGSVRDVADSGTIYYYVSAPNHAAQRDSVQITITPAELTLTANNISVVYGEAIAESAYGYTVSGLVGNDSSKQAELFAKYTAEYSVQVNGKEYAAGVDASSYSGAVTLTNTDELNGLLPNYSVQAPVAGGLTVTGRAIRVEIGSVPNANYGAVLNATDLSVTGIQATNGTGDGVIAGDLVQDETTGYAKYANVFTLVVKNAEGVEQTLGTALSVGVYTIEGVAGGSRTANYTITFVSGSYSVGQSTLQVVVTGASSAVYDGAAHGYTVSVSGVNDAVVNYTVKYTDSEGEDIEGQPVDAGTYTLHIETEDPNYAPYTYTTEFTITPRPITVEWDVPTLVYNGEDQLSEVTAKYFVYEDGSLSATNSVDLSVALQGGGSMIDAGTYTAEAAFKAADGNYTLSGATNPTTSVTVSPRHIVVTIENKTSEYGDALQTLTATETLGTVADWTNDGKGAIVPGDAKPYRLYIQGYTGGHLAVGSHNIFGSAEAEEGGAIDANYDVEFRDGTEQANHGVYTVTPRAVTISFAEDTYTATYGTQFDFAAAADAVIFARGTGGASGSAFASGESFASVLGETKFAVIAVGYSATSAAGSAFTMQMQLGNTTERPLSVDNYTFTFTDTATLTVGQRAITVAIGNIPGAGEDELLYGTDAVADAYAKLYDYVSVTPGAGVSGSALVNGDTEGSVFSLTVYGTDVVVPDDKTPAGTYHIVGMPIGGNYDITFTGSAVYDGKSAGTFIISVNGDATSGISVFTDDAKQAVFTYDGEEHYLLLTGAGYGAYGRLGELAMADGLNLRAAVNNVEWNVTQNNPFLWQFSFTDSTTTGSDGMPQFTSSVASIKDVTTQNGGVYTVYYIVYMPDNLNYAAATGSFTVKVEQATNEWANEDEYGHEGWAYNEQEADASETNPLFDGLETGSQFTAPQAVFGTAYNQADGTVSGVTFTYYSDDTYAESARIADPDTFFTYNTPADTYYVKVEVAGTDNYTGLTGYYELVVSKHILSVRWNPENLTVDDGLSGTSVLGYNDRFMTYVAADLTVTASGTSFTAEKPANTGRYGATFIIKDELLANYEWANADGNDAANCTIYFTVSEAENVVTVTITTDVGGTEGWTYGDSVTFAAYQLGSAGQSGTIVVTATSMQSVSYAYARDVAGVTDGSDSSLVYNISALPTDAGTYWVRAYVTGDIDEGYGNKAGYAKFTVAKYQVAVPTAGALLGGDGGVYDGSVHTYLPTLDGFTWDTNNYGMAVLTLDNGEQVILRVSGNRAIDAGGHTAKVSPVDPDNYVWDDGSAAEKELEWSIEKQTLARPFIGEDGKYSLTTTYSPSTTMQELSGFNAEVMGFAGAAYGSSYYYANETSYLSAGNAGEYWISISLKYPQNYQWATGDGYNGEDADAYTRLTWTITKEVFDIDDYADIRFAVGEYVYNGQVQYPRLEDAGNLPSGVRLVGYEVTAGNGTDAGEHTVTATFALTGSHADNYTFAAGGNALTQEYTIDKAVISGVTWTVQRHYTYNGEDQFDVVKAYYGLGGSIHELQVGVQEFKNYQEGGYTFTVEGFKAGDENAKNYTLSGTFSETFYIDKLSVYIVVGEATGAHTYDGQRPTLTEYGFGKVAVYGIDGDDLRDDFIEKYDQADWEANMRFALLDADGNEPSAWNVGSYTVTVTGAEDLQNYDVTRIQTGTLEIVPKEITITGFDSPGAAFGDDTFGPAAVTAVSGLVAGETIDVLNFLYTYTGTADDGWTADGTLTNEMHAGSYTVTVSLQGGNYVLTGNVSYSYKVSPMLVDPALVEIDDLPYTGQAQTLTKEDTRFTGTGSAYDLFDYSVAAESGTEVGGYRVTLIIGNANYLWQSGAAGYGNMTTDRTWRIVEALAEDISVSLPQVSITHWGETAASVTAGGSVAAIGGTEISVNITYLFEVKDESGSWVKFTGSVWNAGDYRVRAQAANDNFPAAYSEYHEFTVQPGVYDVSGLAFADMTLTYDGQAHGLVLTVNGSAAAGGSIGGGALGATGTVAYTLGGAETDAGTYTMTATLTAGANYTFAGGETAYELTGTLVIEPYTVTIQWAAGDFTYDKQDHSGDVWAYFIGAGNSHIDLALEGADEMVDAGEYTFTVTGASDQSGAAVDLANYMLAGGDVAGAQKEYTVRKFAAAVNWGQTSFTYNGEDQSASVQPSFIGVGGEEIALSVQPQALRDFGTYTFEVVIGEELKNYELSNTTAQISIAKLPVTVTADDISAALGAAEQTLTYTLAPSEAAGVFAADEAAGRVEVSLSRVPGTAAGAYDIYISVTGEGAENYALTLVGGTYTIRERAIELSITLPADLVYCGAPKAAVLIAKEAGGGEIAVPAGITLWYEGKDNAGAAYASAQAPVNAGSYTVGVRIDTQDYDVSNANITVEMTIERAAAFIDVSGVQTQYTYTGALQRVDGGAALSHGESALVYSNNTFTSVSEGDGKVVSVDAAASCNYKAAHAEVTISVAKAAISPAVSIHGWTYGQSANGYTVTGNPGGGAIEAVYGGTTNAGAAYSGGQAPTEAGSYTLTVTVAETENYLGGSASTSFTVARAALHVSVSIESWAFGESPNGYTVSPAFMRDTITSVRYAGEGYSGSQPPTQVGSYTLTVTFAQTANYQGGSASDSFSITQGTLAPGSVRLTIEGWTYGEAPNSPVLTGAPAGAEVSYRYSGTANDGTAWNSDTAPSKAGSYKVTAHISAEGYASFEAEASFTVARRLVAAPTLGDTGGRTASSVYDGEEVRIAVTGYDGALMDFTAEEGTQLVMEGQQLLLAADAEGTYVLQVSLKDIYNYGWADLAEGEQIAGDIALAWEVTLAMHSLLWLIILLFILLLILIVLLIVFAKKDHDARARIAAAQQGAESGADGAADERQNYALAPAGLLFAVPVWQISLIAALAVAAAVLLVADVVLLVLWRKDAAKAERAEEAVQEAAAAAQDENLQAENAQEAGGDENSASAE